jgi:integrase
MNMKLKGSIKQEANGRWRVTIDIPGKNGARKQKKQRFDTKEEALDFQLEMNYALMKGTYKEPAKIVYKDYLQDWFSTKKKSIGTQTAKVYKDHLEGKIVPFLGNLPLSELTVLNIQAFINSLSEQGLSSSTVKKTFEIIRNSLEYAVDFEILEKNPAKKVKLPKANKKEMTVWNEEEVNRFFKVAKEDPLFIVFHLALTTGLRQGEVLGLRWKDVDLEKGMLNVRQTLSHDGKTFINGAKTKSSLRTVNLSQMTAKILKSRKIMIAKEKLSIGAAYQDFDLIACTQHGTPLNPANVRRTFNRIIKVADVPKIRFHDLRHTHATLLLSKGVNVKVISERLGHSNIKVTLDTYSHVLPTMQEEVARKLDEIIK